MGFLSFLPFWMKSLFTAHFDGNYCPAQPRPHVSSVGAQGSENPVLLPSLTDRYLSLLSPQAMPLQTVMNLHGLFSLPEVVGRGDRGGGPHVSQDRKRRMENERIDKKGGGCCRAVPESLFSYTTAFCLHIAQWRRRSGTWGTGGRTGLWFVSAAVAVTCRRGLESLLDFHTSALPHGLEW